MSSHFVCWLRVQWWVCEVTKEQIYIGLWRHKSLSLVLLTFDVQNTVVWKWRTKHSGLHAFLRWQNCNCQVIQNFYVYYAFVIFVVLWLDIVENKSRNYAIQWKMLTKTIALWINFFWLLLLQNVKFLTCIFHKIEHIFKDINFKT